MLEIPKNCIDIWLTDERQVTDPDLLVTYAGFLNQEESRRHQRFVFTRHQHQFLVARALTRSVLGNYLGLSDPGEVDFRITDLGKPELQNEPGIQFNLSHTCGLIALAVGLHRPVGVDVEHLGRQSDIIRLADRYFSRTETSALKALPLSSRDGRFYDLWTLKEAYLKACGTGIRTPLDAFSFHLSEGRIAIEFEDSLRDDPAAWYFRQYALDEEFRLSLAVNTPGHSAMQVRVRRGIPLGSFSELELPVLRSSAPACHETAEIR